MVKQRNLSRRSSEYFQKLTISNIRIADYSKAFLRSPSLRRINVYVYSNNELIHYQASSFMHTNKIVYLTDDKNLTKNMMSSSKQSVKIMCKDHYIYVENWSSDWFDEEGNAHQNVSDTERVFYTKKSRRNLWNQSRYRKYHKF